MELQGVQQGFMRRKIGSIEVTALLDGFGEMKQEILVGFDAEKAKSVLKSYFLPETMPVPVPVSTYLVNTGEQVILIDAGASRSWGAKVGNLLNVLAAAGVKPEQVDKVLLTHIHPDHVLGAMDGEGNRVFPNAELVVPEPEHQFWMNDTYRTPKLEASFKLAHRIVNAYKDRLVVFDNREIAPGIEAVPLYGHTPGHTGYMISSGQDSLLIFGDIVHACVLQFAYPEWAVVYDIDPAQAVESRKRILAQVAADRQMIAGMHMPFPGFGYAVAEGNGYGFVPAGWQYE